jgi:hypothetical protein
MKRWILLIGLSGVLLVGVSGCHLEGDIGKDSSNVTLSR